jgi:hypothetical protein
MRVAFVVAWGFAVAAAGACASFGSTADDVDASTTPDAGDAADPGDARDVAVSDVATDSPDGGRTTEYRDEVIADAPLAYFELESAVSITSSVSSTGCNAVGGGITVTPGIVGKNGHHGLNFDGQTGYLDCGNNFDFSGMSAFTIEAWIKPSTLDLAFRYVVSKDTDADGGPRNSYEVVAQTADGVKFERYVNGNNNSEVTFGIKVGEVHHVVGVFDGSVKLMRLYVDGAQQMSKSDTGSGVPLGGHPFLIGAHSTITGDGCFSGEIDDVAIYAKALPEARIQAHWEARNR